MKIRDGFITRKIGETYYAVCFDESSPIGNGMMKLSNSAYFVWGMLEKGSTEEDILEAMKENFDAEEEVLRRDLSAFLATLREHKIIVE